MDEGFSVEILVQVFIHDVEILVQVSIHEVEILNALVGLKLDKSPGLAKIYSKLLKEAKEEIAGLLTEIFQSLLATSKVPDD